MPLQSNKHEQKQDLVDIAQDPTAALTMVYVAASKSVIKD